VAVERGTVVAVYSGCTHYKWGRACGCGITGYGSGNGVLIEHDNGYRSYYGHLHALSVQTGDRVQRGQRIAAMGNTGNTSGSSGVHLHFKMVRHNLGVDLLSVYPNANVPAGAFAPKGSAPVPPSVVPDIVYVPQPTHSPTHAPDETQIPESAPAPVPSPEPLVGTPPVFQPSPAPATPSPPPAPPPPKDDPPDENQNPAHTPQPTPAG